MDQVVAWLLNSIFGTATTDVESLVNAPGYVDVLRNAAVTINDVAVKPLAAVVVAIMVTLSLVRNASRMEGDRVLGVKIIASTMFAAALTVIVVQNASGILDGIIQVGDSLIKAVNGLGLPTSSGTSQRIGDEMHDQILKAGFAKQLAMFVVLLFPWLIVTAAGVMAKVLIVVRWFEIYIKAAFAPLPLTFFGNEDTKPMAIGYLRSFATSVLSGVTILIALRLFQAVEGSLLTTLPVDKTADAFNFIGTNMVTFLVPPLVLLWVLKSTTSLARAVVGG
ncbi:type IV secretion system protein [Propionibacterium freudenreichii]|uniref:type IV secretion system protein n=1 Tax=Propionibacterium freudenreichii TaxID=1744 RepID=UPI0004A19C6E|nr:type IV secretion system protein [Propionibacterium freudenreichii]MCT2998514.1 hypothetical protein [Propionibacterium freudenreichii]MCT3010611.1 hypothetical protein [Propionibacterium freudenreichii]MDK9301856.1 type IV secretion system protein [Propionibacterium freudenreichii]MDK9319384.1 type IV secretion system protein [Propionibacterium freudenreichii]MDK9641821.1 type IV secretion system protein [Propionibacterium freudenreichii]